MSVEHQRLVAPVTPRSGPAARPRRVLNAPPALDRGWRGANQPFRTVHEQPRHITPGPTPTGTARTWTAQAATGQTGVPPTADPGTGSRPVRPDRRRNARTGEADRPLVDIVLPVHDAQRNLPSCVATLHGFLTRSFPLPWQLTLVDGASTDGTWALATRLARAYPGVTAWRLPVRGRGAALREAWLGSSAEIVACVDVDVAADPTALTELVAPVLAGDCEIAVGSRTGAGPVIRCPVRWRPAARRRAAGPPVPGRTGTSRLAEWHARAGGVLLRGFHLLRRAVVRVTFPGAGRAVKVARADALRPLLGVVADDGGFFDLELMLAARYNRLRVREISPRRWTAAPLRAALAGCLSARGLLRVAWHVTRGRFRVVPGGRGPRPGSHRQPGYLV